MIDTRINRYQYARAVLVGAVETNPRPTAIRVFVAWALAESGHARCDGSQGAAYNLLNTTLNTAGSSPRCFNLVGVQNYQTVADGVAATIATLRGSHFDAVRAALAETGLSGDAVVIAIEESPWGTGGVLAGAMASYRLDPLLFDRIRVGPVPS